MNFFKVHFKTISLSFLLTVYVQQNMSLGERTGFDYEVIPFVPSDQKTAIAIFIKLLATMHKSEQVLQDLGPNLVTML